VTYQRVPGFPTACAVVLAAVAMSSHAQTSVHDNLEKLAQDITFTSARLYPMRATTLGIAGHDSQRLVTTPGHLYGIVG
jgi:hypothetical protein